MALDSKRMAGIRIYSILKDYSDREHLLTQKQIAHYLERDYGIELERKAISKNIISNSKWKDGRAKRNFTRLLIKKRKS